jgi:hypothetical protein
MGYTLEIHRAGAPPEEWDILAVGADPLKLAGRAKHLVKLWKRRRQDGYDKARVMRGAKPVCLHDVRYTFRGLDVWPERSLRAG